MRRDAAGDAEVGSSFSGAELKEKAFFSLQTNSSIINSPNPQE